MKSKKKDHSPSVVTPSTPKQAIDVDAFKQIEDRISKNVKSLFENLLDSLDEVVDDKINRSLSAPSLVPEPASKGGAGGDDSRQRVMAPQAV